MNPGLISPQQYHQGTPGNQQQFGYGNEGTRLTKEELDQLHEAGVIGLESMKNYRSNPIYDVLHHEYPPVNQADIQQMFHEFKTLQTSEHPPNPRLNEKYDYKNQTYQQFNVTQELPVVPGIYDKKSPSAMFASMPAQSSKNNFSSYLVSIPHRIGKLLCNINK